MQIYILEEGHNDKSRTSTHKQDGLYRECLIIRPLRRVQSWIKQLEESSSSSYPLFNRNLIPIPSFSVKLSPQ